MSYIPVRRVKQEQQRLTRQVILLSILAVGLISSVLFFLLPMMARFLLGNGDVPQDTVKVPLQTPVIQAPASATSSANISLSGFSQTGTTVILVNNGQQVSQVQTQTDGRFATDLFLSSGENQIAAFAKNAANEESALSQTYTIVFDDQAPTITITAPENNARISGKQNQLYTVTGSTEQHAKVTLNDRLLFVKDDGTFSTSYQLQTGENTLTFVAIDPAHNQTMQKVMVRFE